MEKLQMQFALSYQGADMEPCSAWKYSIAKTVLFPGKYRALLKENDTVDLSYSLSDLPCKPSIFYSLFQ
jgi:hypothetical protein